MPAISNYHCSRCDFALPSGWGSYMYVIDDLGNRIVCPHPGEGFIVACVLGPDASRDLVKERTGHNSHCVCRACLCQFGADLICRHGDDRGRDPRVCPQCGSEDVRTVEELVGRRCPKCKVGRIVSEWTGTVA